MNKLPTYAEALKEARCVADKKKNKKFVSTMQEVGKMKHTGNKLAAAWPKREL